ncbi:MAG: hypothetical protein MZV70_44665 [Desulfobacterales bacterium]|nr:hypothetical protein [Desulfobacterales bacterium]
MRALLGYTARATCVTVHPAGRGQQAGDFVEIVSRSKSANVGWMLP